MNVQLANTYNPAKNYNVAQWYATPKFDGVRAVFIPGKGFFTRNDKPVNGLAHMAEVLERICSERGLWFIDGELIVQGKTFQASQGVILASEHEEKSLIEYHVFAVGGEFMNTAAMLDAIPDEQSANIFRVDSEIIPDTFQAVEEACRKFTSMGYEGVVLRDPNVSYFEGRSDFLRRSLSFRTSRFGSDRTGCGHCDNERTSYDILELAARFYADNLNSSQAARAYLERRKLNESDMKRYTLSGVVRIYEAT